VVVLDPAVDSAVGLGHLVAGSWEGFLAGWVLVLVGLAVMAQTLSPSHTQGSVRSQELQFGRRLWFLW
jgi:hypothetical protein